MNSTLGFTTRNLAIYYLEGTGPLTAEIAILTRSCVALAADSAVTIGDDRVYKSAHKLFALSKAAPIAAMIFNNADYFGVPWETVIKTFRSAHTSTRWNTIEEVSTEFFNSLSAPQYNKWWSEPEFIVSLCTSVFQELTNYLDAVDIAVDDPDAATACILFTRNMRQQNLEPIAGLWSYDAYRKVRDTADPMVRYLMNLYCEERNCAALEGTIRSLVISVAFLAFRDYSTHSMTGIVISGFGDQQIFPALCEYHIDGCIDGKLRAWQFRAKDLNDPKESQCLVIPFAVSDEVYLLMERIDEHYIDFLQSLIDRAIEDYAAELIDAVVPKKRRKAARQQARQLLYGRSRTVLDEFAKTRKRYAADPILRVLHSLPKEELAAVAEALVELTSLQCRVAGELETVGGPVDVAIVSKGDGLVWIKRKHYFDIQKNPDFLLRQLR